MQESVLGSGQGSKNTTLEAANSVDQHSSVSAIVTLVVTAATLLSEPESGDNRRQEYAAFDAELHNGQTSTPIEIGD